MTSFWYRGKIMTTEPSQPARPHVNPNLALSAHDTGWEASVSRFFVPTGACSRLCYQK